MPVRPLDWNLNAVFAYSSKFFGEFDQLFFGKNSGATRRKAPRSQA